MTRPSGGEGVPKPTTPPSGPSPLADRRAVTEPEGRDPEAPSVLAILLRNGTRIELPVTWWRTAVFERTGQLAELEWTLVPDSPQQLLYVDPREIAAVTELFRVPDPDGRG